jgi:catechol 2,3-dioxygenase
VEEIAVGKRLASGRRVRFQIPTGHWVELYAEKAQLGNGLPTRNPPPFPDDLRGIAPNRLEHIFVFGPHVEDATRFFTEVLEFDVTERLDLPDGRPKATFLACNNAMHDIGLVEHDEPGKLHHFSFWLDSLEQVHRAGLVFGKTNVPIDTSLSQHGIGRAQTIYFFDPSGNRNEVFSGSYVWFPDRPTLHWDIENAGRAIFFPEGRVDPEYLEVLT